MHLYEWNGKTFQDIATLEGNKGVISALAFSSEAAHLAAGDVSGSCLETDRTYQSIKHRFSQLEESFSSMSKSARCVPFICHDSL